MKTNCCNCGVVFEKQTGDYNKAKRKCKKLFCSQLCFGKSRQISVEQKKLSKREYDKNNRIINKDKIKLAKALYHKKTYDKEKEAVKRKTNMQRHINYCRRPEYKKWKSEYDIKHRAKKNYGEYWESFLLVTKIEKEYDQDEVRQLNNLHNKSQKRKRTWQTQNNYLQRI